MFEPQATVTVWMEQWRKSPRHLQPYHLNIRFTWLWVPLPSDIPTHSISTQILSRAAPSGRKRTPPKLYSMALSSPHVWPGPRHVLPSLPPRRIWVSCWRGWGRGTRLSRRHLKSCQWHGSCRSHHIVSWTSQVIMHHVVCMCIITISQAM